MIDQETATAPLTLEEIDALASRVSARTDLNIPVDRADYESLLSVTRLYSGLLSALAFLNSREGSDYWSGLMSAEHILEAAESLGWTPPKGESEC